MLNCGQRLKEINKTTYKQNESINNEREIIKKNPTNSGTENTVIKMATSLERYSSMFKQAVTLKLGQYYQVQEEEIFLK